MSRIISITIVVEAAFLPEEIEKILLRGHQRNCKYFREITDINIDLDNHISVKEAVKLLFSNEPGLDGELFSGILTYNEGTFFFLYFKDLGNYKIKVDLTIDRYPWERVFYGLLYKDYNRYYSLLFDLIYDFPLVELGMEQF